MTLRGMATVSYFAADLSAACAWYTEVTGVDPYFRRPGYAEWRLGDHEAELGIIEAATTAATGAILYWHVDDVEATLTRLLSLGATAHEPLQHRGHGFITATVLDPFGNLLGIMHNPHYLDELAKS
ncbi:VOC family protein [Dactylosporangium matsuzakiense]|uniref:Glyoxalase n=1 Tax=Dactylosporangium matsuzakiense TaxID=53360 RepID=A0A9W6KVJ3_9ACTN|nr:VOC family protein [Dactylosporangium matsuzakiense]UWZ48202.1 VOC family protein [Dactylosporangium matsuzakiense]GLL08088.1 glyoxalase [Dactylosporangium matsuzakiense]